MVSVAEKRAIKVGIGSGDIFNNKRTCGKCCRNIYLKTEPIKVICGVFKNELKPIYDSGVVEDFYRLSECINAEVKP
jgi:hypothetical protein